MEGVARAGEKRTPGHAGKTVNTIALHSIAFISHVHGRSFMICAPLAFGSFGAAHSARTALRKDQFFPFESRHQLRGQVHDDPFLIIRNLGGKRGKLFVWHQPHIM